MSNTDIKTNYSNRLRNLRKKLGYTQQELADLSGIEYKHIQRIESKKTYDVKLTTIEKIARAFNRSVSAFLDF